MSQHFHNLNLLFKKKKSMFQKQNWQIKSPSKYIYIGTVVSDSFLFRSHNSLPNEMLSLLQTSAYRPWNLYSIIDIHPSTFAYMNSDFPSRVQSNSILSLTNAVTFYNFICYFKFLHITGLTSSSCPFSLSD